MAADHPRPPRPAGSAQGKQIEEILDVLYRRRWIIAGVFLLVAAGAVAYVSSQKPLYSTSALILIDLDRAASGADNTVGETTPFVRDNRSVYTELFVLQSSRGIRERVANSLGDEDGRLPPGGVSFELADRNVSAGIAVNAVSPDPQAAAALANAYAREYVAQTQLASRSYLTTQREFLEEQQARLRGEVDQADARVSNRTTRSAAVGTSSLVSRLSGLQAQRDDARIELQTRRNKLASINDQLGDITPGLTRRFSEANDRRVAEIEANLVQLRQRLQPFERREAAGQPIDEAAARTLRRQIDDFEREKRTVAGRFVGEALDAGGVAAPEQALSYVADLKSQATQERIELQGLAGKVSSLNSQIGQLEAQLGRAALAVRLARAGAAGAPDGRADVRQRGRAPPGGPRPGGVGAGLRPHSPRGPRARRADEHEPVQDARPRAPGRVGAGHRARRRPRPDRQPGLQARARLGPRRPGPGGRPRPGADDQGGPGVERPGRDRRADDRPRARDRPRPALAGVGDVPPPPHGRPV